MRGFLRFGACDGFLWLLWKEESRNKDLGGCGGIFCFLDVKSGLALILSSGRVLEFNCFLKARHLFCN